MVNSDLVAMAVLLSWPVIPIFWVPVHFLCSKGRRPGILPYIWAALVYVPIAWFLLDKKDIILAYGISTPWILVMVGWLILALGLLLHVWTILVLRRRIIGVPEVIERSSQGLVVHGPFRHSRHPTYLAHHLIFWGAWLITGRHAVLIVAVLDLVITHLIIIPLEEKELKKRFGKAFEEYARSTPRLFNPNSLLKIS